MPLFELDDGRLVPAQYGRPVTDAVEPGAVDAVRHQVLEIVGRPLLPIRVREARAEVDSQAADLVALDPNGRTVAVGVVGHVDAAAVLAVLGQAGAAGRLSWAEIAQGYPRGAGAFREDWAAFRESAPRGESGPPAVLVAFGVDEPLRPALEALAGTGLQVIELVVRQMSSGRRFVDASEVRRAALPNPRPVLTPSSPRRALGRTERFAEPDTSTPTVAIDLGAAADLRLIGAALASAVDLTWGNDDSPGRAVLTTEGTIVLHTGQVVADPVVAAQLLGLDSASGDGHASGNGDSGDAWSTWRIGADGPTLAEARAELRAASVRRPRARAHRGTT